MLLIRCQTKESEFLVLLYHRIRHFEGYRVIRSLEGELYVIACIGVEKLTLVFKVVDAYAEKQMDVAASKKARREFMSGKDVRFSSRFWMQSPMFLPSSGSKKGPPPPHVHPWVANADRASYAYRANPRPPVVYGRRDGAAVPIRDCDPPCLCAGDVVAFTFNLIYHFTDKDWHPQYQPLEVYVLKQSTYADLSKDDATGPDRLAPAMMDASVVEDWLDVLLHDHSILTWVTHRSDG